MNAIDVEGIDKIRMLRIASGLMSEIIRGGSRSIDNGIKYKSVEAIWVVG